MKRLFAVFFLAVVVAVIAANDGEKHHNDEDMDYFQHVVVEDTPAPATPGPALATPTTPLPHVTTPKPDRSTSVPRATSPKLKDSQHLPHAKLNRREAHVAVATLSPATPVPQTSAPATPTPTPQPTSSNVVLPGNCNSFGAFSSIGDVFGWSSFAANQCPAMTACLNTFCSCRGGMMTNSTGTPMCITNISPTTNYSAIVLSCARQRTECLMQPLPLNATSVNGNCSLQLSLGSIASLAATVRAPCVGSGEAAPLIDLSQMMSLFNPSAVNYSNSIIQEFTVYWSAVNNVAWNASYLANASVVNSLSRFVETKVNKTFGGVNPYVMTLGCMASLCPYLYRTTGSNYSVSDLLSACNLTLPPVCPPAPPVTTLPPGAVKQVEAVQLRITGNNWGGLLTNKYSAVESMVKSFLALTLNVPASAIIVYGLKSGSLLVDFGVNQESTNLTSVAQAVQRADLSSVQSFYTATTGSAEVLTSTATVTTVTVGGTVVVSDKCGATCVGLAVMGGIIGVALTGLLAVCVYKKCCRNPSGEGQKMVEEHYPNNRENILNQQGTEYHSTAALEPVFEQYPQHSVMMTTVTPTAAAFKSPNAV